VTRLFNTMETILQYRIFERLRNQESSVYSPSVSVQQIVLPTPYYEVNISVSTDPQRVDAVTGMIKEELERLADEGPTEAEIQKVMSESLVSLENSVKQDAYWHRRIRSQLQHDEDPALILKNEEIIKSLTVEKMQAFLRDHLDVSRLKEFIL